MPAEGSQTSADVRSGRPCIPRGDSMLEAASHALIFSGIGCSYVRSYETCRAGPGTEDMAAKALRAMQADA